MCFRHRSAQARPVKLPRLTTVCQSKPSSSRLTASPKILTSRWLRPGPPASKGYPSASDSVSFALFADLAAPLFPPGRCALEIETALAASVRRSVSCFTRSLFRSFGRFHFASFVFPRICRQTLVSFFSRSDRSAKHANCCYSPRPSPSRSSWLAPKTLRRSRLPRSL